MHGPAAAKPVDYPVDAVKIRGFPAWLIPSPPARNPSVARKEFSFLRPCRAQTAARRRIPARRKPSSPAPNRRRPSKYAMPVDSWEWLFVFDQAQPLNTIFCHWPIRFLPENRRLKETLPLRVFGDKINLMLQTVVEARAENAAVRKTTLAAYRFMLLARLLDDKFAALYRAGKIHGGVFLGRGQEALSVAVGISLNKTDVFAPLIRDAAGRLAFGETILDAVRTYLGSPLGPMRGRDGNVHRGKPLEGYFPMISHLGAMISVVNGALFARRMKGISGTVGATCLGDGATSTGAFHEALNQAAVEKLPLVMVLADNQYAYSTPTSRQFVCA